VGALQHLHGSQPPPHGDDASPPDGLTRQEQPLPPPPEQEEEEEGGRGSRRSVTKGTPHLLAFLRVQVVMLVRLQQLAERIKTPRLRCVTHHAQQLAQVDSSNVDVPRNTKAS
jgi:hypothetical protein